MKYVVILSIKTDINWNKTVIKRDLLAAIEAGQQKFETLRGAKIRVRTVDKD